MNITKKLAEEMLNSGNELLVAAAKQAFPELVKSNFEMACERLNIDPFIPDGLSISMRAQYQLEKITEVANEGWTPSMEDDDEYKYYPYFEFTEEGMVLDYVSFWASNTVVPAPSLFKSRELCEKAVNDNIELYRQMFLNK